MAANAKQQAKGKNEVVKQNVKTNGQEDKNPKQNLSEMSDEDFDKGGRDGQIELGDDGKTRVGDNKLLSDTNRGEPKEAFVRKTKIEKSSSNISIKSLHKEWRRDQTLKAQRKKEEELAIAEGKPIPSGDDGTTLRFDLAIQRNETWTDYQKSDFIHSVLYGYYIPPVLVQDSNDGKKWFLDGKQRLTTLMTYIEGSWALSKKTKPVYGHKIAGHKFKDLSAEMQDEILDETITLVRLKNMTEDERDEMFVKQNSGSPLSRMEMTRAMHSELIESINEIARLPFFKDVIELSKRARNRFVDQEIILQIAMLLEEGKDKIKGFGANHIEDYVMRLKQADKTLSEELMVLFESVSSYLALAFEDFLMDEIKRVLKKINIPIIFVVAQNAMRENLQPELFGSFIKLFLVKNYSVSSKYGKSSQAGSSKKENVLIRIDEMNNSFNQFIQMIKNASSTEEGMNNFDEYLANENGIEFKESDSGEE